MPRPQKLTRRDGTYYVRIHTPADLVAAMDGKKEVWRSLRTKDYAEAKRRELPERDQAALTFEDMRRRHDLTEGDIGTAVWDHYSAGLAAHDAERLTKPTPAEIDAARHKAVTKAIAEGAHEQGDIAITNALTDFNVMAGRHQWAARRRAARLKRLRNDLATGDTRLIEREVDAFLGKYRFTVEHGSLKYRALCEAMTRAEIEQLERTAERDAGDFTGKPSDPIVKEPAEAPAVPGALDASIMSLFGRYEKENPGNVRPETLSQIRTSVQHFADFSGPSVRGTKITKTNVRDWKDLLAAWPVKAAGVTAWKGQTPRAIVAANRKLAAPKPAISKATLRRHVSALSGFCDWLALNDYLPANPVAGLLPAKAPPSIKRKSFTDAQLGALFASSLFRTCRGKAWRDLDQPGNVAVRDHRYWIPLIMAYSGARPGEIAQLHIADVREAHGIWAMHITEEGGEGKRTKTEGSMRLVPIHSKLIELGFVEYRNRMAAAGETRLFPEVEIPEEGQIAAQFSREFNRYMQRIGIKVDKALVVYSLRHTFIDRCRTAGILDQEIGMIVGHDKASMTGRYGTEQEGTLKRRAEIVEAVGYRL